MIPVQDRNLVEYCTRVHNLNQIVEVKRRAKHAPNGFLGL